MTRMEALLLLSTKAETAPEDLPCEPLARRHDETPLYLAALASCSGQLDDCQSWESVCEPVEHGRSLFSAGVLTAQDCEREIREIVVASLDHDEQDAELN